MRNSDSRPVERVGEIHTGNELHRGRAAELHDGGRVVLGALPANGELSVPHEQVV